MKTCATTVGVLIILLLCSCSTMNKSECLNADWQMIGLEDGASGKALSYLGQRRKACADYDVTPDLEKYQAGYRKGLHQYCTPRKGYHLGRKGRQYQAVCPPELEEGFLAGYRDGKQIYTLKQQLSRTEAEIRRKEKLILELEDELDFKESLIISDKTPPRKRADLLAQTKDIQLDIDHIEEEIVILLDHQAAMNHELRQRSEQLRY